MKASLKLIGLFMSLLVISLPVCFADELNLVYDENGNLLSGDGYNRTYNSLNQLIEVRNESGTLLEEFTYHPRELRVLVKKTYNSSGSVTETVYYIDKNFVRVVNDSGSYDFTYVYHNGQLVAQLNPEGSKYFIASDHIGSSSVVTNESGDVIENTSYSPFGTMAEESDLRYSYTGKEFDSVVNDYDFHARKYKAEWGLFLQPDDIISDAYDPQILNHYSYVRNNPYKTIDPDGKDLVVVNYEDGAESSGMKFGHTEGYIGTDEAGYVKFELYEEEGKAYGNAYYEIPVDKDGKPIRQDLPDTDEARMLFYETDSEEDKAMIDEAMGLSEEKETYNALNWMCDDYVAAVGSAGNVNYRSSTPIPNLNYNLNRAKQKITSHFTSSGGIYRGGGRSVSYSIYRKRGKVTGGRIGSIGMSSGFAKLFRRAMSSRKKSN